MNYLSLLLYYMVLISLLERFYDEENYKIHNHSVIPHFVPGDFCKLFRANSPVIKCSYDINCELIQGLPQFS